MDSLTKNIQTNESLERMIKTAFGEKLHIGEAVNEVKVKELKEGFYNAAYEIILPDRSVILKIAPAANAKILAYEKNMMEAEVNSLRLVKEKTKVPVPDVLYYDQSHSISDADYFFMNKVEGISLNQAKENGMPPSEQEMIYEEIGRYNLELNEIRGNKYGYFALKEMQGDNWEQVFAVMIESIMVDGERIQWDIGMAYDEVRRVIEKSKGALNTIMEPRLVHWDLWEGNIFTNNGKVTAFIDFERVMWADPLLEYFFRTHCYNEAFVKGYGENLKHRFPVKAYLYDIYLYLILAVESGYRCYPSDWLYNFAKEQLEKSVQTLNQLL